MKLLSKIGLLFLLSLPAFANQAATGFCSVGNVKVVTAGLNSTNVAMGSFPSCSITVNVVGGGLATLFSDNIGTPLSNPFTAGTNGAWTFYAANGHYSVSLTATGLAFTYPDVLLNDPATAGSTFTGSFVSSSTANPALTGFVRMAATDAACWRNNANSGDVCLTRTAGSNFLNWPNSVNFGGSVNAVNGIFTGNVSGIAGNFSGGVQAATVSSSGGTIDNTTIGSITPSTGAFTTMALTGALSGLGATFSSEVAPSATGNALGDTAHRWDLFLRNLDISGSITGALNLTSLNISGNMSVGGTLGVTGATTLSTANVTSNETVGGTLGVTGQINGTTAVFSGNIIAANISGGAAVTGSGATNSLTKFTNGPGGVIGNSGITDNGTTVSVTEPLCYQSINNVAVVTVSASCGFTTWTSALAALPSQGGTLDGRAPDAPTAIGTFDPGTAAVTILLGGKTYTVDHIIMRAGLKVAGMGVENVQGTKIQAVGSANQAPFVVANSTNQIQGVILQDFQLQATVGNTSQDGIQIDLNAAGAGNVWALSRFSRITLLGFKGSALHLKGNNTGTVAIQNSVFDTIFCDPPQGNTTIGACFRAEGGLIGQNYYLNNNWGVTNSLTGITEAYIGVISGTDTEGPYSQWFYGTTVQDAAVGVLINGCQACVFRDTHAEVDQILFQVKTPSGSWHNGHLLLSNGEANGNVGVNGGAGSILDVSDVSNTATTSVTLENWNIEGTPDKVVRGLANAANPPAVILRNNKFDTLTPAISTTGTAPTAAVVSGATINAQNSPYVYVGTAATYSTLQSTLGPGETITLYANASGGFTLANGGNIVLNGYPSPLTLNQGEQVTLQLFDAGGTMQWITQSTTAARANGYFSSTGRTTLLTATTFYTTGATDGSYLITVNNTCRTQVATATATATIIYTDTSNTVTSLGGLAVATCTTLGSGSSGSATFNVSAKASTNIQVSVAIANSPNYDVRASAIKLGGN